ncbi:hypothetical protein ACKKBG_A30475 [Auxenochlorella protothecoides x Auxenochlorella symbiontica]
MRPVNGHAVCDGGTCSYVSGPSKPASKGRAPSRPPGAPAGSWEVLPWWHCAFVDPYERVNFWSHSVPAVGLAILCALGFLHGSPSVTVYAACAATTHGMSALTHVFPESRTLEKADHIGIVATIVGTPVSAMLAHSAHGISEMPLGVWFILAGLFACAWARPFPRTSGFIGLGTGLVYYCWDVINLNLTTQILLYICGAVLFLRNSGHSRWPGLSDHHGLHYCVTIAASMHLVYLYNALHPQP